MKQKTTFLKNFMAIVIMVMVSSFALGQTMEAKYEFATDGDLNDTSGNARTLTKVGSPLNMFITDNDSNATSAFDAHDTTGEYLTITGFKGVGADGARTVAAWVNLRAGTNRRTIASWGINTSTKMFNVMIEAGKIRIEAGGSNIKSAGTVANGSWHHVAVTYDPNDGPDLENCKMYIDAVLQTIGSKFNGTVDVLTDVTTNDVRIGEAIYGTTNFLRGSLNDVIIYSSALTGAQVALLAGTAATAPVAGFSASNTSPSEDEIITFTDASTNAPAGWSWDFGAADAIGDTGAQNPQVSYPTAGTYTVTLTASNAGGSDDEVKTNYITVSAGSGSGDLQVKYDFDGGITDASTYGRDLSATGAFVPTYEADHLLTASKALTASGVQADHLITGYPGVAGAGNRSVTAWFKTTATQREPIISWGVNSGGKMFNVMIANGAPRVEGGASSLVTSDTGLNDDAWHHIAVTYDSADGDKLSNCKIYIGGVLSANETDLGASFNSEETVINTDVVTNFLKIGSEVAGVYTFDGAIDDVRVFSKALTALEIVTIMGGGTLGINEIPFADGELSVYPSLVTDFLTVKTSLSEKLDINIYNLLGVLVKKETSTQNIKKVDMQGLSKGLYIINLRAGSRVTSLNVIKN